MYGGKPFSKTAPMGYGENNGHYYLIGRKNIPIGTNIFRTEKVYVIDDQVYAAGERLYLDTMRETVKQSERDLEGLSGDVVIFKRMTN